MASKDDNPNAPSMPVDLLGDLPTNEPLEVLEADRNEEVGRARTRHARQKDLFRGVVDDAMEHAGWTRELKERLLELQVRERDYLRDRDHLERREVAEGLGGVDEPEDDDRLVPLQDMTPRARLTVLRDDHANNVFRVRVRQLRETHLMEEALDSAMQHVDYVDEQWRQLRHLQAMERDELRDYHDLEPEGQVDQAEERRAREVAFS